eukprot:PhM_4_TR10054/c5_g3_i1/m.42509/K00999/CDIPT; CDP-diacylglycerol--inositol 3-phosphatidyltransferase
MVSVYLYVANLIGYVRVALALWCFAIAYDQPVAFLAAYTISFVLDAADGHMARLLGQCSTFGAILDMITDRFATGGLVLILTHLYRHERMCVVAGTMLIALDLVSHYVRMYSTASGGRKSHKDCDAASFWFLNLYYTNRTVMALCCIGQEGFYLLAYAAAFWGSTTMPWLWTAMWLSVPLFVAKQVANLMQFVDGMMMLAREDERAAAAKKKQ